jgi:hypothetical protein
MQRQGAKNRHQNARTPAETKIQRDGPSQRKTAALQRFFVKFPTKLTGKKFANNRDQRQNNGEFKWNIRLQLIFASFARLESALPQILLQKSKVASDRIFGETLKHEAIDDSDNLSRVTEVAYEFSVRR